MKNRIGASTSDAVTERESKNREIAYRAATEGIVLLTNDGCLPLTSKKVALFGSGAICTVKGGTGSGEVNERYSVNIYDGLKNAGFEITSKAWLESYQKSYDETIRRYDEQCKKAAENATDLTSFMDVMNYPFIFPTGRMVAEADVSPNTETAIFVVARQAGENGDKKLENGDFELLPEEFEQLQFISEHFKNTVLVINSGASMDVSVIDQLHISALLFFCQQGTEGGTALADILSGKVSPSGKLTDTWAMHYSDIPFASEYSYLSGDTTREYYREDIYVGYRYFDSYQVKPRFAFGHGLSYTTFEIKTVSAELAGTDVQLRIAVKNTGSVAGKEVVQAYISAPNGKLIKEYQRLVAFGKTKILSHGETEEMTLSFPFSDCKSYDTENAQWLLEAGEYVIRIGNASDHTIPAAVVVLGETVILSQNKNVCSPQQPFDTIIPPESVQEEMLSEVPRLSVDTALFQTETVFYQPLKMNTDPQVQKLLRTLSVKDMIDICVGTGVPGTFKATGIVSLGAVGRTTDRFFKKGLVNVNLADGPAGVRLLRRSAIRGKTMKMVDYLMGFVRYLPSWILKWIMADPKKDTVLYQYCTAFPVGTSLAQTWNAELCEEVGRAISAEMSEFMVTYWLAPGMNIHRNPLCGRNFEYYSEDPLLTGKIAVAITKGVQETEGNYVTIKHFACNNQEDNRNRSDSIVSERALREIYLRGFEICVSEAKAKAVMTSYNLINGTYAPNRADLLTDVLRSEWGFDGVVMTDWSSTKEGLAKNNQAIKSGNDMLMPGGREFKKALKKAYRSGTLTKEDLEIACSHIICQILSSKVSRDYFADEA